MDDHAIDFAGAYRSCRPGFFLLAAGLLVVCAVDVPALGCRLMGPPVHFRFWRWMSESGATTLVRAVAPWTTLAGSALLWAAWDSSGWRRRAGLLMTMCLFDVGSWILDLGDPNFQRPDAFLRSQIGAALGWAQFSLLAGLAGEILTHLGIDSAGESARASRSLAATGATVWLLLFVEIADLRGGWPLRPNAWISPHVHLLGLGSDVLHAVCLVQTTALAASAFRRLNDELRRIDSEESDPPPF